MPRLNNSPQISGAISSVSRCWPTRTAGGYRTSKFVVRHKAGVLGATLVALILIAGIIITMREARIAQRRFNNVRTLANSLIFDVHDSIRDLPGSTPARKIIVERALQYLNGL